ncbi:glycosyltransferase family 8 protein [Neisseria weaveri]|uniref:glycosyltransferase family 8 protein n=1 Tax=Neisseria weaveri TaxID=28091 RepID=UPI0007C9D086|nr:glycosyltransferase family 8 protein [Neisseria weaveri]SAY51288.1 lipooligosaccharyl-alpha-1, 4-galactosyltransferase LgtC [Neisseria weaveri]
MNIVFASDDNYASYLGVTIFSILMHNQNAKIDFYILDLGISAESREAVSQLVGSHGCSVSFVQVDKNDFIQMPQTIDYISIASYARLKVAEYLQDIDRALYLDVDILVTGSLQPLWETDLEGRYVGACFDPYVEFELPGYKNKIGLQEQDYYFNAGVLLMDLGKWRDYDVFAKTLAWLGGYRDVIQYQDQDILNGIFKDKVKFLDCRFNFMPFERSRMKRAKKQSGFELHPLEKATVPVVITHYCGKEKAWHADCVHTNAYLFADIFRKLEHVPHGWTKSVCRVGMKNRWEKIFHSIKDKYFYSIY